MPTLTLPRYLLSNTGTELENFDSVAEWTVALGAAIDNATPGEFRSGTGSIKLTNTDDTGAQITKAIPARTFATAMRFRLYVYFYAADVANINRINIAFRGADWTNYIESAYGYLNNDMHAGWNCIEFSKDYETGKVGTGWETSFSLLRITMYPKTGTICNCSLDSLIVDIVGEPAVMFTFDDGHGSIYTNAFPWMRDRGVRGTIYLDSTRPGTSTYCTVAQLQEIWGKGWSIANHSNVGTFNGLTQAQVETAVAACETALTGWGMIGSAKKIAYPACYYSATVIAAMSAQSMQLGRTCWQGYWPILEPNGDNLLYGGMYGYDVSSLATLQAALDNAILYKRLMVVMWHQVSGSSISVANFQAFVDYVCNHYVPCITITDLYNAMSSTVDVTMRDISGSIIGSVSRYYKVEGGISGNG